MKTTGVRTLRAVLFAAVTALLCVMGWRPPGLPSKPIRMIVGPPRARHRRTRRMIADGMHKQMGQPVVVDFRPGASGMIGAMW